MKYSICIFKSVKTGSIVMFPMGFNKDGIRSAINKLILLNTPYTEEELGKAIYSCFEITITQDYESVDFGKPVFENATGIKSYSKFVKEYKSIFSTFEPTKGYQFQPSQRAKDNSYVSMSEEITETVLVTESVVDYNELARAVEKCLELSR